MPVPANPTGYAIAVKAQDSFNLPKVPLYEVAIQRETGPEIIDHDLAVSEFTSHPDRMVFVLMDDTSDLEPVHVYKAWEPASTAAILVGPTPSFNSFLKKARRDLGCSLTPVVVVAVQAGGTGTVMDSSATLKEALGGGIRTFKLVDASAADAISPQTVRQ